MVLRASSVVHRGLDEDAHVVGVITEHIEACTTSHDARLFLGDACEDLLLGLKHPERGRHIVVVDHRGLIVRHAVRLVSPQGALQFGPPGVVLSLQAFYLVDGESELLLKSLDDSLVVEGHAQAFRQLAADTCGR